MRLLRTLILAGGISIAVHGATPRTDINPALIYFKAFTVVPDLSEADRDYLYKGDWRNKQLDNRFGELVTKYDNEFKVLRKAGESKAACDWGLDISEGPEALLPALAKAKFASQTACLRARWFLQNGKEQDAINDLLSTFVLARNVSRDGVIISALVQIAMENIITGFIAENFYQFTDQGLQQLIADIDAAPTRGTMRQCLPVEKAGFGDWFIHKVEEFRARNGGDEEKTLAEIRRLYLTNISDEGEKDTGFPDRWIAAVGGTSEGVLNSLREMDAYYREADRILQLPPAQFETAVKVLQQKIEADPKLIAGKWFPFLEKAGMKEFGALVKLAMFHAAIQYRLNGEQGLKSVIDPAGTEPFSLERFTFEGADRGFKLKSKLNYVWNDSLIFVESPGAPFYIEGPNAGKPISAEK